MTNPLVTTRWLAEHLDDPNVRALDGSWHMPAEQRDPHADYLAGHIPGAAFFDIDAVADRASGLPHMLATPQAFATAVAAMGIGDDDLVVVYDTKGVFSAARVWWTFRAMGHDKVAVLDGGLPAWKAEGRPVRTGLGAPKPKTFKAQLMPDLVRDHVQVRQALADAGAQVVDARPAARFTGQEPEPRAGLRGGHMPGARNLPSGQLTESGHLKPPGELKAAFEAAGVDLSRPIITTCGSGITAALLALGLHRLGVTDAAVYDGSWTQWGALPETEAPVVAGPAD